MLNVLVLLMGKGQGTSERPASFHEHRAVWLILSGLIKSPSNPSVEIIMCSIFKIYRRPATINTKGEKKTAFI